MKGKKLLRKLWKGVKKKVSGLWRLVYSGTPKIDLDGLVGPPIEPPDWREWSIYPSLADLPFKVFQKAYATKDYGLLCKPGATEEQKEEVWISLLSDFYVVSGDPDVQAAIQDMGRAEALRSEILRVKALCATFLSGRYSAYEFKWIEDLGYRVRFEHVQEDVELILRKLKNKEVELDALVKHLEKNPVESIGETEILVGFTKTISAIERVFKVGLNPETMTALMYAVKVKELRDYSLKKQEDGQYHR